MSLLGNWLNDAGLAPLAVAIVALILLMSPLRRRRQQQQQLRMSARPAPGPSADRHPELRRDVDTLLVELEELSRRISADIDMRFAKLESAIHDADRRIAALSRLARQSEQPDRGPVPETARSAADQRHAAVYELADSGLASVEIARELGKTPGEVELILNLRKSAPSAPGAPLSERSGTGTEATGHL
jgi:hypothetical protein